jgi:hypothetical protein
VLIPTHFVVVDLTHLDAGPEVVKPSYAAAELPEPTASIPVSETNTDIPSHPFAVFDRPSKIATIDPVSNTITFTSLEHALSAQFGEPLEPLQVWFQDLQVPKGWAILYTTRPFWLIGVLGLGFSGCVQTLSRYLPSWCTLPSGVAPLVHSSVTLVAGYFARARDITITLSVFEFLGLVGVATGIVCYALKHFARLTASGNESRALEAASAAPEVPVTDVSSPLRQELCNMDRLYLPEEILLDDFSGWSFDQIVHHVYKNPEYPDTYMWTQEQLYGFLQWERDMFGRPAWEDEEGSTTDSQDDHVAHYTLPLPRRVDPSGDSNYNSSLSPSPLPTAGKLVSQKAVVLPSTPTAKQMPKESPPVLASDRLTRSQVARSVPLQEARKETTSDGSPDHTPRPLAADKPSELGRGTCPPSPTMNPIRAPQRPSQEAKISTLPSRQAPSSRAAKDISVQEAGARQADEPLTPNPARRQESRNAIPNRKSRSCVPPSIARLD